MMETHGTHSVNLGVNQNELQLGEQLFLMLEDSKWQLESILDEQKDLFVILDPQRRVLRSNVALARILGCDPELCIGRPIDPVFNADDLGLFKNVISEIFHAESITVSASRQIELNVQSLSKESSMPFLWTLQVIRLGRRGEQVIPAVLVTGRDITDLRNKERQIDEMFTGIPLGIVGVGQEGSILGVYSSYSKLFFGERNVIGERLSSILSELAGTDFSQAARESFRSFDALFGEPQLMVELVLESMPKEQKIRKAGLYNSEGYLGLTYQPVFRDGCLEKILVLLEDRTQLVREREERSQSGSLDPDTQRMVHLKRQTPEFLSFVERDADGFLSRALRELKDRSQEGLARALHGLKGTARVARFELLFPMVQELEGLIKQWSSVEDQSSWSDQWKIISKQMAEIEQEWRQTRNLIKVVHGSDAGDKTQKLKEKFSRRLNRLMRLSHMTEIHLPVERSWIRQDRLALLSWWGGEESLESILLFIDEQIKRNESAFACSVVFESSFYKGRISGRNRRDLMEIILHLVNNSFAHALEPEHKRLERAKPARMRLKLKIALKKKKIRLEFSDDGRGVDPELLRKKLVDLNLKSAEEARIMSDDEAQSAIFISGLSTQSNRDEVSGTGVGLSAVLKRVQANNGKLKLSSKVGEGSTFAIEIPMRSRPSQRPEVIPLDGLKKRLMHLGELSFYSAAESDLNLFYRVALERVVACLLAVARYPLDQDCKPQFRLRLGLQGELELGVNSYQKIESETDWMTSLQAQEMKAARKDLKVMGLVLCNNGDWFTVQCKSIKNKLR